MRFSLPATLTAALILLTCTFAVRAEPPAPEPLPDQPWHTHLLEERLATPEGETNAPARWLNEFLQAAFEDHLQQTLVQTPWRECDRFLHWALWGYLSTDSRFRQDPRLIAMSQAWLDRFFQRVQERPQDAQAAKAWQPGLIGDTWNFHIYSLPLLEIQARPDLAQRLGSERVQRYRQIVLDSIAYHAQPEKLAELETTAETYVNLALHPLSLPIHGWVLTGEARLLEHAQRVLTILERDQMPNGMFPYRRAIHGSGHLEYENMYYHAVNLRAVYLYWWHTESEQARRIMERAAPYYPLNLEPPYHFNGGADIWWKDQWRTYWLAHVAMVAAVSGDAENAGLARRMSRDNISRDQFDTVLGAHAYQQMARRPVGSKPLRDRYVIRDPDIRGLRLRFSPWAATFTTGSFTFTRASAMLVEGSGQGYTALHLARPYLRVAAMDASPRHEMDYSTLPGEGAAHGAALLGRAAAAGTSYRLALTPATWAEVQPRAPWAMSEVWLLTDRGMVALIDSECLEAFEASELAHQFRFIPPGVPGGAGAAGAAGAAEGPDAWRVGPLRLRVWQTNLPHRISERGRRYALSADDRRDWQLSLSDSDRSPEEVIYGAAPAGGDVRRPQSKHYEAGTRYTSLVSIEPADRPFRQVKSIVQGELLGLEARQGPHRWLVLFNRGEQPAAYALDSPPAEWAASWEAPPPREGAAATFTLPPGGTLIVQW